MSGNLALFMFEVGCRLLVFLRYLGPFGVPTFQIEKFDPSSHTANIRIGVVR
jgi:hypothetical protein